MCNSVFNAKSTETKTPANYRGSTKVEYGNYEKDFAMLEQHKEQSNNFSVVILPL